MLGTHNDAQYPKKSDGFTGKLRSASPAKKVVVATPTPESSNNTAHAKVPSCSSCHLHGDYYDKQRPSAAADKTPARSTTLAPFKLFLGNRYNYSIFGHWLTHLRLRKATQHRTLRKIITPSLFSNPHSVA
ncbi:hypothetical protein N9H91_04565 [Pseudomonadales bacterium]|nr:hypothetical protein [Pseudomonadales bacterium]